MEAGAGRWSRGLRGPGKSQCSHSELQEVRGPLSDGTFAADGEHGRSVMAAHLQCQEITHGSPVSSGPPAHSQALGKLALSTGVKGLKDDSAWAPRGTTA